MEPTTTTASTSTTSVASKTSRTVYRIPIILLSILSALMAFAAIDRDFGFMAAMPAWEGAVLGVASILTLLVGKKLGAFLFSLAIFLYLIVFVVQHWGQIAPH